MWLTSHAISVAAGEAGSGQWEEVEGILSMGCRDKLGGLLEGGKVSGIEV
jgi:hypothetical protein